MYLKYFEFLLLVLFLAAESSHAEDKWMKFPKGPRIGAALPPSYFTTWIANSSKNIFRDGENIRAVKGHADSIMNSIPVNDQAFEIYNLQANYGSEGVVKDLAKSFYEREIGKLDIFRMFRGGINFKLGQKEATPTTPMVDKVYYGLVLKDIKPSPETKLMASFGSSSLDDFANAPKAQLKWNIEKKYKVPKTNPYRVNLNPNQYSESKFSLLTAITDTRFSGNIKPQKFEPGAGSGLKIPNQIVSLNQKSGFYSLQVVTGIDLEPESMMHVFNIKLGSATLRNELNMDGKVLKRSLLGLTYFRSFRANFHQIVETNRYLTELAFRINSQSWSITADTFSPNLIDEIDHDTNRIEIAISQGF